MKKFIISESEKRNILGMYGLLKEQISETPICDDNGCTGTYTGPEFNKQGDIAHQYSNVITKSVASKLKELYKNGKYVKVNFDGIKLSTKGMGTGNVVYKVEIPFVSVSDKCDARTGFAHVGGWNHTPELNRRKKEILDYKPSGSDKNLVLNDLLDVSELKKTKEGLEEYFIQWRHREYQGDCGTDNKINTSNKSSEENKNTSGGYITVLKYGSLKELLNSINNNEMEILGNPMYNTNKKVLISLKDGNFSLSLPRGEETLNSLKLAINIVSDHNSGVFPSKDTLQDKGYEVWDEGTFQLSGEGTRNWALMYK